jgi:putative cardiolipin synthase
MIRLLYLAFKTLLPAIGLLVVAGCAGVPFDYPREESHAEPPSRATRMGRSAAEWYDRPGQPSGFLPLPAGEEALGARLRLIEAAERTIDIQYFLAKPQLSAWLIAEALIPAADRGVRVRVLFDDVFTTTPDEFLAAIDSHPNIELRLYNPVSRSGPNWFAFLSEFSRTNRRMHNKSFTVDNAITIIGGRNIADEYYALEQDIEFADYDLLGVGPVASEVSKTFDRFWNSNKSVPIKAFFPPAGPDSGSAQARRAIDPDEAARAREVYAGAVNSQVLADLEAGRVAPFPGSVTVVTDPPQKLGYPVNTGLDHLFQDIRRRMLAAQSEVVIISPYFVPGKDGVKLLKTLRANGVDVIVITNSLASTNHAYVHGGYFPYRKELLEAGVRIYEAKADAAVSHVSGAPVALTLHTKMMIIDRKTVFVGSLNMDPRSIELNTEMGIFVESAEYGNQVADAIYSDLPPYVYEVDLDQNGKVIWHYGEGDAAQTFRSEPGASFWSKFVAGLVSILPVEGQL